MKPVEYLFWLGEHVPKGEKGSGVVSPLRPETRNIIDEVVRRFRKDQHESFLIMHKGLGE